MEKKKPIVIKRYANRKLYNTNDSCYITLNEIARMVRKGVDVKIIDYKNKKDITSATLAQIIFEKEKKQKNLSSQTLKDIIQSGGGAISDFFQKRVNLGQIREEAEKTVEAVEKLFTKSVFTREDGAKLMRELIRHSYHSIDELQHKMDDRIKSLMGPLSNSHLLRKEVDALSAQVDLLDEKIASFERMTAGEGESEPEVEISE